MTIWQTGLIVEIALGADLTASPTTWTWTDITQYVYRGLRITRGYQDESAGLTAGQMSLALKNKDGRFNPFLATGPYYGLFNLDTPIRVRTNIGETVDNPTRFTGYISDLRPSWEESPTEQRMQVVASSIIRKTERSTVSRSPLTRFFAGEVDDGLIAYWPCEDESDATQAAAELSTHTAMRPTGAPEFGADNSVAGSLALPKFPLNSSIVGNVPASSATAWTVHFMFKGSPTATGIAWLASIATGGATVRWEVRVDTPFIALYGYDAGGAEAYSHVLGTADNFDGKWHSIMIRASLSGGNMTMYIGRDGQVTNVTTRTGTSYPVRSVALMNQQLTNSNPVDEIWLGHCAVFGTLWTGSDEAFQAMSGFLGEEAVDRFARLCNEESIHDVTDVGAAAEQLMGPQPVGKIMDVIRDCAETDGALVTDALDGRLLYTSRSELTDRAVDDDRIWATLSVTGGDVYSPFEPVLDDQQHVTDVTASRPGGSSGRFSETSPTRGVYQGSASVNPADDAELESHAAWRVHRSGLVDFRYPQVAVKFRGSRELLPGWLSSDGGIGGRFKVVDGLTGSGHDPIDLICIGYTETISVTEWNLVMNTVPTRWYRFGVVDDEILGRVDTAGSELVTGVDTDDTSWSVATTSGPLWIQTATHPAEFPFDIRIGGETVTVTAIVGASSPQTFTVQRSVNGVVKSHSTGASLALADPMRAGL